MREFMDFCLEVLGGIVGCWFDLDLGGYAYGDFMVALLVVSVFITSLCIKFRQPPMVHFQRPRRVASKPKK